MFLFFLAIASLSTFTLASFVSTAGQSKVIPSWKVQSSAKVGNDAVELSSASLDTSAWYAIGSKATLMATLLENGVYTDNDLFYSQNLEKVDYSQFKVPWFYRTEFDIQHSNDSYLQLKTNGVTSRADIYLNGALLADKNLQAGAYGGLTYDITSRVKSGKNILLIRTYPTDYNRDFALGFVDWNPYPPDNGTGIWRDVEIKQTGGISVSLPRVTTKLDGSINIKAELKNWQEQSVNVGFICSITDPRGKELGHPRLNATLPVKDQQKVSTHMKIGDPEIWWPKQWGSQPLYNVSCTVSTPAGLSDVTPKIRFGIRSVASTLNAHNDTAFFVNDKPFQVLGAGYTSDMFLRFDESKLRSQFKYVLDMGLNTVRLEGKQEHPYLYELADEMGVMVMAGWECCDKWEGWSFNDEGSGEKWNDADYEIANASMRHEAEMMQHHPSMLAFLVGSDFWPDDRAVKIYVDALKAYDWDAPIIASASQRGYPELLGNGGMKMEGPYDFVSPNYWYGDQLGAAFGFGSELGASVGTPEINSLQRFLSPSDQKDLWTEPNKGLYHMSTNVSSFYTRKIYNDALWKRYGAPTSLSDYLLKSQMTDYEATRAEFEAYSTRWMGVERPATGLIYWMLNNAWPSLHWNLFDYYLHPGGSYFGTKVGNRLEHVAYDYASKTVYLINRSLHLKGARTVGIELLNLKGSVVGKTSVDTTTEPNSSKQLIIAPGLGNMTDVALLRLLLQDGTKVLSRNVYWLSKQADVLDWDNSTWYHTPLTSYADFTALNTMEKAVLDVKANSSKLLLENKSQVPAIFVRLNLVDEKGQDVVPVLWSDNYITLWPGEKAEIEVEYSGGYGDIKVDVSGKNVEAFTVRVGISF